MLNRFTAPDGLLWLFPAGILQGSSQRRRRTTVAVDHIRLGGWIADYHTHCLLLWVSSATTLPFYAQTFPRRPPYFFALAGAVLGCRCVMLATEPQYVDVIRLFSHYNPFVSWLAAAKKMATIRRPTNQLRMTLMMMLMKKLRRWDAMQHRTNEAKRRFKCFYQTCDFHRNINVICSCHMSLFHENVSP